MALSGTYELTFTMNDLIQESFELLQIAGDGETLSGNMLTRAKMSANLMFKSFEQDGPHLWTETEGSLFLAVGQEKYDFSTAKLSNNWFETTLSADASSGAGSITVTSASDILSGDTIGIILDDNDLFWTTVNGTPVGASVVLTDVLTGAASSGNFVRNYRDTFIPAVRINNVRRKESTDYEIPIVFQSRKDYFNLPNKSQQGTPIQAYFSRQQDAGIMYVWNSPSSSVPVINFSYERKMQIVENTSDDLDFPPEQFEMVAYQLAKRLLAKFSGTTPERAAFIINEADKLLDLALSFDSPVYPVKVRMTQHG